MAGVRSVGRGLAGLGVAVLGLGWAGGAVAAPLQLPSSKPVVQLDVPDGWTREPIDIGVQLTSPEGKSVMVVGIVDRDRAKLEAWEKKALARVKAFGVAFDDKAKAPPPVAPKPIANGMDFASGEGAFTFSGPPSLAMPGAPPAAVAAKSTVAGTTFESLTDPNFEVSNKPKFKVIQYVGTTLDSKPVDVQFGVYSLADKRFFAVIQESAADDTRAVAIAKSLRAVK